MVEILVLGELEGGRLDPITGEMVAAARGLQGDIGVALLGNGLDAVADEAIAFGADKVILAHNPLLAEPTVDAHVAAFEQVCRQTAPTVVLVGRPSELKPSNSKISVIMTAMKMIMITPCAVKIWS